jgi:hypothetical protein
MRKLTYSKAATCGENLKARVTLEQSEKMQLAWFAAGKTWNYGSKEISCTDKPFLFLNDVLTMSSDSFWFENNINNEIELIDDPQHDFASQQEIYLWLGQGNKIKNIETNSIIGFKDEKMHNFTGNCDANTLLLNFENWQKHTPPRLIRVNGVVVPAPLESLEGLDVVYIVDTSNFDTDDDKCKGVTEILLDYADDYQVNKALKAGLLYGKYDDTAKRAEAMRLFEVVE